MATTRCRVYSGQNGLSASAHTLVGARCSPLRRSAQRASDALTEPAVPGPSGAFEPGREAQSRQKLFNRIAPVYDEVDEMHAYTHTHMLASACRVCLSLPASHAAQQPLEFGATLGMEDGRRKVERRASRAPCSGCMLWQWRHCILASQTGWHQGQGAHACLRSYHTC